MGDTIKLEQVKYQTEGRTSFELERRLPNGTKVRVKYYVQDGQSVDDGRKEAERQFQNLVAKALLSTLEEQVKVIIKKCLDDISPPVFTQKTIGKR